MPITKGFREIAVHFLNANLQTLDSKNAFSIPDFCYGAFQLKQDIGMY